MKSESVTMYEVCQKFDSSALKDVGADIDRKFQEINLQHRVLPSEKVAVGVGSRDVHNLPVIVAAVVKNLRKLNLNPFIFPAMGSHGGATSQGQIKILNDLGITEQNMGVPIVSSMEVQWLGTAESGAQTYIAKDIMQADHLVIVNRVKPHTAFRSSVESGLCKMLAVGCGKHKGAVEMHKYALASAVVPAAQKIMNRISVLCGLAVVENGFGQTHSMRLVCAEEFVQTDMELLEIARELMPKIPVLNLDLLVVDEMGKNISGAGMDPNVIGSWRRDGGKRVPDYRTLMVLDLTSQSQGNALGIGMADITTRTVTEKIDYETTYTNVLTTGIWASGRTPVTMDDDKKALDCVLEHIPEQRPLRMARITNTLKLEKFWVTKPVLFELRSRSEIFIKDKPLKLEFTPEGRLKDF